MDWEAERLIVILHSQPHKHPSLCAATGFDVNLAQHLGGRLNGSRRLIIPVAIFSMVIS